MQDAGSLLKPGDKVGRYELLLPLAQGGMGAVWVARFKLENGFEKLFAVKTLLGHLAEQTVFREMFLAEARIAAGIEHPNVAQIIDMGEKGDSVHYLVMEWVEGDSLNSLARAATSRGQRIPYGIALRVLADSCAGLHAVHEHVDRAGARREIVHRDVSPHNILVSANGTSKVIDFGVAKTKDRLVGGTVSGAVKGKLRYMAPEQACGRTVDRRADVWGVGAVLYTLVTGRYPFAGESDVDILRMMMAGKEPDPLPPQVPEPIERVIKRAMSLDPAHRYATAAELAKDLELAARQLGVETSASGVAQYVESIAGERLAKLREAIRISIDDRESLYATLRRKSMASMAPFDEVNTKSGTLASSSIALPQLTTAVRNLSLSRSIAALGGIALCGAIGIFLAVASRDRKSVHSANAATIAPATAAVEPAPLPAVEIAPAPAPVAENVIDLSAAPDPTPAAVEVLPAAAPAAPAPVFVAAPRPVAVSLPAPKAAPPARPVAVVKPPAPPAPAAAPPKKKSSELSAIDTRR